MPRAALKSSKTNTTPHNMAEHLRTPEEMAAYLDAWLEEAPDDAAGIAKALGDIARSKGMSQVAKDAGLSLEPGSRRGIDSEVLGSGVRGEG